MKNLQINIGAFIKRRGTALVLASALAVSCLSGCSNDKCEIPIRHTHKYVNEEGYIRYIESEKNSIDGYLRSYDNREITDEESSLYKFLNKKGLIRIDENIELLLIQQEVRIPFTAYEYSEVELTSVGKVISLTTNYYFTNDPEHENLTGKEVEIHYIYQAYKVEKDYNGKYQLIPSPLVEDILEVMDEYPYVKEEFYIMVDKNNVGIEVSDDLSKKVQDDKILKKTNE